MVEFILNNDWVKTDLPEGLTLLDYVRYQQHLKATKIGCREGDCGACTLLVGEPKEGAVIYRAITSCITPLANVHGKHVVTLEGLNMHSLTPVQSCMVKNSATQCGFCTPGFVASFTAFCLSNTLPQYEHALASIDGNICRCTGYKSIQRAAKDLVTKLANKDHTKSTVDWCIEHEFVPQYFKDIPNRLHQIANRVQNPVMVVGGGTDLYVQKHHHMEAISELNAVRQNDALRYIDFRNEFCHIGAAAVATDLKESQTLALRMPQLIRALKWISSTQIRNIGTIAGNFVNASPIGDFSAIFLSLDTSLVIANTSNDQRICKLKDFFISYKKTDLRDDEHIAELFFKLPDQAFALNFEKVCKRKFLDIASVNSACFVRLNEQNHVEVLSITAGGVAPIPKILDQLTNDYIGKPLTPALVLSLIDRVGDFVSPISDVRGSAAYKSLLLKQLIKAHFITCFPHLINQEGLI